MQFDIHPLVPPEFPRIQSRLEGNISRCAAKPLPEDEGSPVKKVTQAVVNNGVDVISSLLNAGIRFLFWLETDPVPI